MAIDFMIDLVEHDQRRGIRSDGIDGGVSRILWPGRARVRGGPWTNIHRALSRIVRLGRARVGKTPRAAVDIEHSGIETRAGPRVPVTDHRVIATAPEKPDHQE
jgi:hypothetical protein